GAATGTSGTDPNGWTACSIHRSRHRPERPYGAERTPSRLWLRNAAAWYPLEPGPHAGGREVWRVSVLRHPEADEEASGEAGVGREPRSLPARGAAGVPDVPGRGPRRTDVRPGDECSLPPALPPGHRRFLRGGGVRPGGHGSVPQVLRRIRFRRARAPRCRGVRGLQDGPDVSARSEEHTSELQSLTNLVCRLLLAKNKAA